jgi:hypothetical protein
MKPILYLILSILFFSCTTKEKKKDVLLNDLNVEIKTNEKAKKDSILKVNFDKKLLESFNKFIPNTWTLSDSVGGFLNNDNYKDLILRIEKDSSGNDDFRYGDQGVIVLFGNKNGDYSLNVTLLKLLNNWTDCGMIDGRGILSIKNNGFSYSFFPSRNISREFEFIYSKKHSKFFLRKIDETNFQEVNNEHNFENYSLGEIPIESYKVE